MCTVYRLLRDHTSTKCYKCWKTKIPCQFTQILENNIKQKSSKNNKIIKNKNNKI